MSARRYHESAVVDAPLRLVRRMTHCAEATSGAHVSATAPWCVVAATYGPPMLNISAARVGTAQHPTPLKPAIVGSVHGPRGERFPERSPTPGGACTLD